MAQDEHLALLRRQVHERCPEALGALEPDLLLTAVVRADLLEGNLSSRAHVIQSCVPGDPKYPRGERHIARLVLLDRGQELGEDVLRYVLGGIGVLDDAPDV